MLINNNYAKNKLLNKIIKTDVVLLEKAVIAIWVEYEGYTHF